MMGIPSFKVKDSTKTCPVQKLQKSIRHTKFYHLLLACMMMHHRIYTYTYIHTYIHTYTVIYLVILLEELILTALQIEIFIGLYCPLGLPEKSSLILLFRRWIGPLLEL
jgi:hypothetical protein